MADSVHEAVQKAIATRIRAMAGTAPFEDLSTDRVLESAITDDSNILYPCVFVTVAGLPERVEPFDIGFTYPRFRYEYPCLVLPLRRGDAKDPSERVPYLAWRDALLRPDPLGLMGWKPTLSGVSVQSVFRARTEPGGTLTAGARARSEPGQVIDSAGPAWLRVAGSLVVWIPVIR